jgi:hypothetical protein
MVAPIVSRGDSAARQQSPADDLVCVPRDVIFAVLWAQAQLRARLRGGGKPSTVDVEILQAACIAATKLRAAVDEARNRRAA